MAKNLAFDSDGDNLGNLSNAATQSTGATVNHRPAANENTSLNANLDTYFSDEKIIIPEYINVSVIYCICCVVCSMYNNIAYFVHCTMMDFVIFSHFHRMASVFASYGHSPGQVF